MAALWSLLMKQKPESLRRLARMAVESEATKESLAALADTFRDALDLAQVFFVYSEDLGWATCGDRGSGDDVGTKKKGLWLVQQQAEMYQGPVAFNIRDRLVEDLTGDLSARGREYIGLRIPTSESPAELLIMRGHWENGIDAEVPEFVDQALPSLTFFLERMLNAARGGREREQMKALANAAEVLTQSEDAKSVLEDLTTAIANVIGYEIAILNI
ncbi:unnamed protein product, partial [marine sediment metagenome]